MDIKIIDEAHWLSLRGDFIGGSEVAALFANWRLPSGEVVVLHGYAPVPEGAVYMGSCSPYKGAYELWLEKAGKVMPADFNPNERMIAGTYLEPAIAQWSMVKWGWKLRKVRRYSVHPTVEGWGCSVDYEEHAEGMVPVEIKNIDFLVAKQSWVIDGDDVIDAPLHILLQLQHYIGGREADSGWIVPCIGGNELARGQFKRHDAAQAMIAEAITAFWAGVRADTPPANVATFVALKEEFALGGGSFANLEGDKAAAKAARRYLRWKAHEKFLETAMDRIKGELAMHVAQNTKVVGDGFSVTWPVIEREEKVIPARLQKALTYRGGFTVKKKD